MIDKAQLSRDAKFVNGTPEGERLLEYLFTFCHVYQNSFDPDPYKAAFNEGQRSVALELISLIVNKPSAFKAEMTRIQNQLQQQED